MRPEPSCAFDPMPADHRSVVWTWQNVCRHILFAASCLLVLITVSACASDQPQHAFPQATAGHMVVDVGLLDAHTPIPLAGEWQLQWGYFAVTQGDQPGPEPVPTTIPGTWDARLQSSPLPAQGFASYRLVLELPPRDTLAVETPPIHSAYRLFAGQQGGPYQLVSSGGQPGPTPSTDLPSRAPSIAKLPRTDTGQLELIYEVSNHSFSHGGIWEEPRIGEHTTITGARLDLRLRDQFVMGALSLFGLFNMMLIFLRYRERAPLFLGLFALVIAGRTYLTGHYYEEAHPQAPLFDLLIRLEYLTLFCAPAIYVAFLRSAFPTEFNRHLATALYAIAGLCGLATVALPPAWFTHARDGYLVVILVMCLWLITALVRAAGRRRNHQALLALAGFFAVLAAGVHDVLHSFGQVSGGFIVHYGLMVLVLTQAVLIALQNASARHRAEVLGKQLQGQANALKRFVPHDFLRLLGRNSIIDVQLGDHTQKHLAVLFADVRNFTSLSEQLTPVRTFGFINALLQRVGPVIRAHNGFIDKYLGDGIMALFPRADDALHAAVEMQAAVREFNATDWEGTTPVRLGIGVHTGNLMLCTLGEAERMDGTVISDAVNLTARIESTTKKLGADILASQQTFDLLEQPDDFQVRTLGPIRVKGRQGTVVLVELLNGLPPDECHTRLATRQQFEAGVAAMSSKDLLGAIAAFEDVLAHNPSDRVAAAMLERCRDKLAPQSLPSTLTIDATEA